MVSPCRIFLIDRQNGPFRASSKFADDNVAASLYAQKTYSDLS